MKADVNDMEEAAVIGKMIEEFAETPVGRYLDQCADLEIEQGIAALKAVNPYDTGAVHAAQSRVWQGENFKTWMREAIAAGIRATQLIEHRKSGEPE